MWEDRKEEIFRNFTDLRKNCGKQRDSVNERFKKKRINLCGFFKDKLPGKNLLWSFLVGYFCSQDAFPIPNNPAPPNTSASKHRKCVFSIEYCRKDVNKLDRPKQLVKFIRVDPVFCLVGKGEEESIFMGVSFGSFKRYQLSKVCIRRLIQKWYGPPGQEFCWFHVITLFSK